MIKVHLPRLMRERRLKIADLERMTDIHRNSITKLYYFQTDGIKFKTLSEVCKALDCKVEDLLEYVPDQISPDK